MASCKTLLLSLPTIAFKPAVKGTSITFPTTPPTVPITSAAGMRPYRAPKESAVGARATPAPRVAPSAPNFTLLFIVSKALSCPESPSKSVCSVIPNVSDNVPNFSGVETAKSVIPPMVPK